MVTYDELRCIRFLKYILAYVVIFFTQKLYYSLMYLVYNMFMASSQATYLL